jgi:hypothetical protein
VALRPIAREIGVARLVVGSDLMLTVNLERIEVVDNRAFVPNCEQLDYIIDEHFYQPAMRRELAAPDTRYPEAVGRARNAAVPTGMTAAIFS